MLGQARFSGAVAVGLVSTPLLDADVSRTATILSNGGAEPIWVQLSEDEQPPTAVVGEGLLIAPGARPFRLDDYTGPLAAIVDGAAPSGLAVVEL